MAISRSAWFAKQGLSIIKVASNLGGWRAQYFTLILDFLGCVVDRSIRQKRGRA